MDAVESALKRLMQVDGVLNACVIGLPTGQVLGSVQDADPATPVLAGAAADVVRVVSVMTALGGRDEDLEDVVVTLGGVYHVVRPLGGRDAEGLILLVTLDRARTNLALARRQLQAAEVDIAG